MSFEISGGRFLVEQAGRVALDSDAPMMNLVPDSAISLVGYDISWPDFWSGVIFGQGRQTVTFPPGDYFACNTWVGIVEQEWGPTRPSPHNLPDIVLGAVPTGTNYLEVWVNLTRTVVPAKIFDLTLSGVFPESSWVKLEGGSALVEELMGVARLFEIVIVGTNAVLRRYQSVNSIGGSISIPATRANPGATAGNQTFFYGGTNAPEDPSKYATYGQLIQQLGPNFGAPTHRPNGKEAGSSNNVACSMDKTGISYASTWSGQILIKPGRVAP